MCSGTNALISKFGAAWKRPCPVPTGSGTRSHRTLLLASRGSLTRCGRNFLRKEFWTLRMIHWRVGGWQNPVPSCPLSLERHPDEAASHESVPQRSRTFAARATTVAIAYGTQSARSRTNPRELAVALGEVAKLRLGIFATAGHCATAHQAASGTGRPAASLSRLYARIWTALVRRKAQRSLLYAKPRSSLNVDDGAGNAGLAVAERELADDALG